MAAVVEGWSHIVDPLPCATGKSPFLGRASLQPPRKSAGCLTKTPNSSEAPSALRSRLDFEPRKQTPEPQGCREPPLVLRAVPQAKSLRWSDF